MVTTRSEMMYPAGLPAVLTIREFAAICAISEPTAREWVYSEGFDVIRMPSGRIMVPARVVRNLEGEDFGSADIKY